MGNLQPDHSPCVLDPHPHPHPRHPRHQKSTKSPNITSDKPIKKTKVKCLHHSKPPSKGLCVIGGIIMSKSSCNVPSCGPEGQLPGYIVKELVSQPDEPVGEAHMPVVHLPANVPPPIALSETGYPIGIAGPDGSPAWAKPKASVKPPKHEHGHEHRCHKNAHRSHHHHHPATAQTGPEYLIPLGTPVPNPYGPGFIFLPPTDPRIIPCKPAQNPHYIIDYDDLDTIQGDNLRHQGNRVTIDSYIPGYFDEEIRHEYTRMRLRAEQSERARFEEIERNQALWNARQKEYEKTIWLTAMGKKEEEPENDAGSSTRHTAASDEERVININVRHPCKSCKELVTIDTQVVHQRFSTHDASQGIGINVDSPAPKLNTEVLCEKCKAAEAEQEKSTDLLRKLVQEVFAEADTIKKAKKDEELKMMSSRSRGVISSDYLEPHDPRIAPKHHKSLSSYHGKEKSTHFENMPGNTGSSQTNLHAHNSKHHLHRRSETHMPNVYRDNSDSESSSSEEIQVAQSNPGAKSHKGLSRSVLAALDKERVFNKENARIISSINDDDDENEEEVIVIRRARRHNDKNNGTRSRPTLVKSATEDPEDTLEAVARRLVSKLALSPVRADSFHGSTKVQKHDLEQPQEPESDSGSSDYSVSAKMQHRSSTQIHKRRTHTRITSPLPNNYKITTAHRRRRHHHHKEQIVDDENYSDYHGSSHGHYDDDPYDSRHHRSQQPEATENAAPGFLSGWSLFRKTAF